MSKELSNSIKTASKVVYETFQILKEAGGTLPIKDIREKLSQRLNFSEWELYDYGVPGAGYERRWTTLGFYTTDSVKAGYIIKNKGIWTLTEEGEKVMDLGPVELVKKANEKYKEWEKLNKEDEDEDFEAEIGEEVKLEEFDIVNFCKEIDIDNFSDYKPHSLGDPERIKISQIVYECSKNNRVLPNFQRYFDRTKERIKSLLESIFKDYYIGSFLLWKSRQAEVGVQPILGVEKEGIDQTHIILDGQQRITSLYYAIKAPHIALKRQNRPTYFYINFYNFFTNNSGKDIIEYHEHKFDVEETYSKLLFPMYELENFDIWLKGLTNYVIDKLNGDNDTFKRWNSIRDLINDKLKHIRSGFEVPYISLPESIELYQVADIFEQINTKGKLLTIFDLLIARLYKYKIVLRDLRDNTVREYKNIHRYYKEGKIDKMPVYIIQTISLLHEKNSSAKKQDVLDIYSRVYENGERNFENDWNECSDYINRAIERLENISYGYGVKDEKALPFEPMIPVLSALLKLVDDRKDKVNCYKKIDQWYWASVFTNAYSFSADSQKTLDFKEFKKWIDDDSFKPKFMEIIEREVHDLYLLEVQKFSNSKYKGVLSILAVAGAKDFDTAQSLGNARKNDKDHIFPRVFHSEDGSHKNINSVLNITWLSSSTNKSKQDKKPSVFIPKFISEKYDNNEKKFREILSTHLIDEKAYDALIKDNLQLFLQIREKNITDKVKELVGLSNDTSVEALIQPNKPFSNELAFINMLKSCDEYIFWLDRYFSKVGLEFLSESISDMKSNNLKDIKIILSKDKVSDILRDKYKKFRDEIKHSHGIDCNIRVIVDPKEKSSVHDRFLVSKYKAYNIPSTDTTKIGQLSEITESPHKDELLKIFNNIRENSKDIIQDWNEIKNYIQNS